MRGLVLGGLALAFLQALVGTKGSSERVGGGFTLAAGVLNHLIDPAVPLIPDRSASAASAAKNAGVPPGKQILAN